VECGPRAPVNEGTGGDSLIIQDAPTTTRFLDCIQKVSPDRQWERLSRRVTLMRG